MWVIQAYVCAALLSSPIQTCINIVPVKQETLKPVVYEHQWQCEDQLDSYEGYLMFAPIHYKKQEWKCVELSGRDQ